MSLDLRALHAALAGAIDLLSDEISDAAAVTQSPPEPVRAAAAAPLRQAERPAVVPTNAALAIAIGALSSEVCEADAVLLDRGPTPRGPAPSGSSSAKWFFCRRPNPRARCRLFCLPYAGGSAMAFREWHQFVPPAVELCPIELPGRWSRRHEPMPQEMSVLGEQMADDLAEFWDLPIVLFGHSMGGLAAFELARALRRRGIAIRHLHVAARSAPQWPRDLSVELHHLPDDDLLQRLIQEYAGIPSAVLEDRELLALVLPVIRADMTALETYDYVAEPPLPCPISVYAGTGDRAVKLPTLRAWQAQTEGAFSLEYMDGDHFFPMTRPREVVERLWRHTTAPNGHGDELPITRR